MCLGIPGKIIEVKGDVAMVDVAGTRKEANVRLMKDVRAGEYVIIHAGFAIEKVDEEKAEETLRLIRGIAGL
ncbi:MAG TPA: HypC/HybG/HupF family hydrogenase formation chaperone [Deltaproteobacteria bacterium]|nr:MAG: hydrogenase assembly protein HypC [Deltaproteobacteria bacterium GWA2_55_82]OGQ64153.1 MAG: hydrogenase assembly protein HypC [Deltaproteobacteria bacterium RIFCSPLOWO2_02_FULL_55_12]OIJ74606.1 MAG: hydrogenase assembly protein HypC [Deltaproteobacteria bacterium GWC2_55_46]HBG46451.1 HypC/HybG/HupF family hydrogenase formation chaperone [Deltaproteobacteria bacterium]HCY10663.1 HypC/HybG/HupF family hydrogenase formation chaperone [Deltaproteobacteria bacterium]